MKKYFYKISLSFSAVSAFLIPYTAFGFSLGAGNDTTIGSTLGYITEIVDLARPLLAAGAFIVFFWGLSKFILNSDKQTEIENGKNYMMWGILVLFILMSYMTIIGLIKGDLFGNGSTDPRSILLPTGGGSSVTTSEVFRLEDGTNAIRLEDGTYFRIE